MIEALLPPEVAAVEAYDDLADAVLFPEEEAAVGAAVEQRRREFATARRCAREALVRLGRQPVPVPAGPKREPVWPAGVVGSITHCVGYRAAAVADTATIATLGIDAEPNQPLPDGVLDAVTSADERARLRALRHADPGVCWDRLLFCVKESVYKAWFPVTRRWLGFEEAAVTLHPDTFQARLLVADARLPDGRPLTGFVGRWSTGRGLLVTAIAVPAAAQPALNPAESDPVSRA